MILGYSLSLHNKPDESLKLHPRYNWCLHWPMNEMKYIWMNEADSVFVKEGFLVEVPYVEPSFLGSLDVKSMIPRSHGIWMNDMKEAMCYMLCAMIWVIWRCYVLCEIRYL